MSQWKAAPEPEGATPELWLLAERDTRGRLGLLDPVWVRKVPGDGEPYTEALSWLRPDWAWRPFDDVYHVWMIEWAIRIETPAFWRDLYPGVVCDLLEAAGLSRGDEDA